MDTDTVSTAEKDQEWIQKYRAALDLPSGTESRMKSVYATFRKVAGILSVGMRSILKRRAIVPSNAAVSKQPTKAEVVQTPTMPDRRLRGVHRTVAKQSAARKRRSPRRQSGEKAS
jgi:hypothetical protein